MSILKKTLAAALTTTLFAFGSSYAATTTSSTYVQMSPGAIGDFDDSWSIAGKQPARSTGFVDDYTFDILDAQDLSLVLAAKGGADIDAFQIIDAATRTDIFAVDVLNTPVTSFAWSDVVLNSGVYVLEVAGDYNSLSGGSYSGLLLGVTPEVTAVPEPENLALLLAGLGMMGLVVRRKKQS